MRLYIFIFFISNIFSQEVFEGYVLFTPGGGGGGATTYLKDVDLTNINETRTVREQTNILVIYEFFFTICCLHLINLY